jgi:hypothetical protein
VRANSTAVGLVALMLCSACAAGTSAPSPTGTAGASRAGEPRPEPSVDPHLAARHGLVPTQIGRGPEFQPVARAPRAGCERGRVSGRFRAHVELFGRRHAIVIPAGIGIGGQTQRQYGRIVAADCRAGTRTLDPSGVVHFDREGLRLGDLFAVWGQPLGRARMLSFRGPVSVFVGGRRVTADPGDVPLRDGAQIVVESGGYVPPHPSFRFPPRTAP